MGLILFLAAMILAAILSFLAASLWAAERAADAQRAESDAMRVGSTCTRYQRAHG